MARDEERKEEELDELLRRLRGQRVRGGGASGLRGGAAFAKLMSKFARAQEGRFAPRGKKKRREEEDERRLGLARGLGGAGIPALRAILMARPTGPFGGGFGGAAITSPFATPTPTATPFGGGGITGPLTIAGAPAYSLSPATISTFGPQNLSIFKAIRQETQMPRLTAIGGKQYVGQR